MTAALAWLAAAIIAALCYTEGDDHLHTPNE
jgi:hypothetical protein